MSFKSTYLTIAFFLIVGVAAKAQTPAAIPANRMQAAQNLLAASDLNTQIHVR